MRVSLPLRMLPTGTTAPACPVVTLRSRRHWPLRPAELWRHRDLLWLMAARDVRVRYKQTVLGASWAVLQPLVMMAVFSVLFGRLMNVTNALGQIPYPIFVYAGLLPWLFFAATVTASSASLVNNAQVLTKVYFPRLIMPVASMGAPLADFAVSSVVLLALMAWYKVGLNVSLLLLPPLAVSIVIAAQAVGILLAGLTVLYRDFRHVVPFMVQLWFYLTPVIYPVKIIPAQWHWVAKLNPMYGTILAFRAAVLGQPIDWAAWALSCAAAVVLLVAALFYFGHVERSFADVV